MKLLLVDFKMTGNRHREAAEFGNQARTDSGHPGTLSDRNRPDTRVLRYGHGGALREVRDRESCSQPSAERHRLRLDRSLRLGGAGADADHSESRRGFEGNFHSISTPLRICLIREFRKLLNSIDLYSSPWTPLFFIFNRHPYSQGGRRGFAPDLGAFLRASLPVDIIGGGLAGALEAAPTESMFHHSVHRAAFTYVGLERACADSEAKL